MTIDDREYHRQTSRSKGAAWLDDITRNPDQFHTMSLADLLDIEVTIDRRQYDNVHEAATMAAELVRAANTGARLVGISFSPSTDKTRQFGGTYGDLTRGDDTSRG